MGRHENTVLDALRDTLTTEALDEVRTKCGAVRGLSSNGDEPPK